MLMIDDIATIRVNVTMTVFTSMHAIIIKTIDVLFAHVGVHLIILMGIDLQPLNTYK